MLPLPTWRMRRGVIVARYSQIFGQGRLINTATDSFDTPRKEKYTGTTTLALIFHRRFLRTRTAQSTLRGIK